MREAAKEEGEKGKVYTASEKGEREENFLEAWARKKQELKAEKTEVKPMNEARAKNATKSGAGQMKKMEDYWQSGDKISIRS